MSTIITALIWVILLALAVVVFVGPVFWRKH